jgi:hypothetical protein
MNIWKGLTDHRNLLGRRLKTVKIAPAALGLCGMPDIMWCEKLWNGLKIPFVPDLLDETMHEGLVVLRHAVPPYVAFLLWYN